MNQAHIVPRSRQTIVTLEELRPLSGRYRFLFPGQRNPSTTNEREHYALRALPHGLSQPHHGSRFLGDGIHDPE